MEHCGSGGAYPVLSGIAIDCDVRQRTDNREFYNVSSFRAAPVDKRSLVLLYMSDIDVSESMVSR